jgi:hypothetical protein
MTLVFARERSIEALKEALIQKRTAVYTGNQLIGGEEWLQQIFERSVSVSPDTLVALGRQAVAVSATNSSEITFQLSLVNPSAVLNFPKAVTLLPGKTAVFPVRPTANTLAVDTLVTVRYRVLNLITGKDRYLETPMRFHARLKPAP